MASACRSRTISVPVTTRASCSRLSRTTTMRDGDSALRVVRTSIGRYIHRSIWAEDVIRWVSSPNAAPQNISVHNNPKWNLRWGVGASVGYKNLSVSYQYFKNDTPVSVCADLEGNARTDAQVQGECALGNNFKT